jgi:hypothetical protein
MASSSGKKKTTMAKRARENRLRERRADKQAKKDARKQAHADHLNSPGDALNAMSADAAELHPGQVALEPVVQPLAELD